MSPKEALRTKSEGRIRRLPPLQQERQEIENPVSAALGFVLNGLLKKSVQKKLRKPDSPPLPWIVYFGNERWNLDIEPDENDKTIETVSFSRKNRRIGIYTQEITNGEKPGEFIIGCFSSGPEDHFLQLRLPEPITIQEALAA